MIISTREAFLGKKRLVPDSPASNWFMVKDFGEGGEWTEEFREIKNLSPRQDVTTKSDAYVEISTRNLINSVIYIRKNMVCSPHEYRYYYNKNLDALFYISESEFKIMEPILDLVFNFLEENIPNTVSAMEVKDFPKEWIL